MTGLEFATSHGDASTWSPADIETQQNLAAIDQLPQPCWFCGCDDPAPTLVCGFCNHRVEDSPTAPTPDYQPAA